MKTCTKCNEEKPLDQFSRNEKTKDGLRSHCRACVSEAGKQHYQKNKETIREYHKQYYQENKEACKQYDQQARQSPAGKYKSYKSSAKVRGISFSLTKDQFMTFWQQDCYYCNRPIATIGIDRIDSEIGYSIENCISCCSVCNYMKLDMNEEEWYSNMLMILRNRGVI
jgi:hypothetical protein